MTNFISYAQNAEDVLLWRALGHIEGGFYIDVGANDPEEHSVTKAFYERGWHGINIEPLPAFHQRFKDERPRDINLALAAGNATSEFTLYEVEGITGWASLDKQVAQMHAADGYKVSETLVQVLPLSEICARHVQGEIHFLKIDVEGFEEQVLRGMDFVRWRPWVLVVEATLPGSQQTNHQDWEHLILQHAYQFAYFDGLNRYYVAQEHAELLPRLAVQPNVFDAWHNYHLTRAWENLDLSQYRIRNLEQMKWEADAALEQSNARVELLAHNERELHRQLEAVQSWAESLNQVLQERDKEIAALYASSSWRVTQPLRKLQTVLLFLRQHGYVKGSYVLLRAKLKNKVVGVLRRIISNEGLRELLIPRLMRFPALAARLAHISNQLKASQLPNLQNDAASASLPPSLRKQGQTARKIHADLQRLRRQLPSTPDSSSS